ncbi:uncharacterized protein [Periplaneta americana]|uniref:uncharacterized protein isoform X3 n=1 Tax=Periplaneta americana TaxID=6978 RepID=UPI0037E9B213
MNAQQMNLFFLYSFIKLDMKQLQMIDAATQTIECSDSESSDPDSIDLEFQRWFHLMQVQKQQELTVFEGGGSFGWEAGHETTADGRCCHPDGRLQRFREHRLGIPKMVSLSAGGEAAASYSLRRQWKLWMGSWT